MMMLELMKNKWHKLLYMISCFYLPMQEMGLDAEGAVSPWSLFRVLDSMFHVRMLKYLFNVETYKP